MSFYQVWPWVYFLLYIHDKGIRIYSVRENSLLTCLILFKYNIITSITTLVTYKHLLSTHNSRGEIEKRF